MLDSFALSQAPQNNWLLILMILWNKDRNWLADHFIGGVPKNAFSPPIPGRNQAVKSLANDRVIRWVNDCCEPCGSKLWTLEFRDRIHTWFDFSHFLARNT